MKKLMENKIYGISFLPFTGIALVSLILMKLEMFPGGMTGALIIMMVFGGFFKLVGDKIPGIGMIGGGTIVCIFGSAFMVYFGLVPDSVLENLTMVVEDAGFMDFLIEALIVGAILSMDRNLLIRASVRFLPVAFVSMLFAAVVTILAGKLLGYSVDDAILYLIFPSMSGGLGAGIIPLSTMYASSVHVDAATALSRLVPALTVANVVAIFTAGLLNMIGKKFPSLSGNGSLMRSGEKEQKEKKKNEPVKIDDMVTGLIVTIMLVMGAKLIGCLIPSIHMYAWLIIGCVLIKAAGILPESVEHAAVIWQQFALKAWSSPILIAVGMIYIDIEAVGQSLTPRFFLIIVILVWSVAFAAAVGGRAAGFYPVESAITAGLCTANMGGTGNLAILSASERMELLPFAQLATRLCGAMTLILASFYLGMK